MGTNGLEETWETFCFLSEDSVLIPSALNSILNVYYFDDKPSSLKHAISLLLPEPLTRNGLRHIYVCTQPDPSRVSYASHPTGDYPPFDANPDDGIIILQLDYRYYHHGVTCAEDEGANLPQVVAIPKWFILEVTRRAREADKKLRRQIEEFHCRAHVHDRKTKALLRCEHEFLYYHTRKHPLYKRTPHLHSEEWIGFTRWGLDTVPPSTGSYVYGSRYLGMSSRTNLPEAPASSVVIYDFNLRNEHRGLRHLLREENVRPYPDSDVDFNEDADWDYDEEGTRRWPVYPSQIVTTPSMVCIPEVFKRKFETRMPYRVTETEMVLPWDSAVLDGERIIGLEVSEISFFSSCSSVPFYSCGLLCGYALTTGSLSLVHGL